MGGKFFLFLVSLSIIGSLRPEMKPAAYNETNVRQFELALQELHKFNFSGSEKVLDIGCGDGRVSNVIAKKYIPNGHLIGIDNSAEMIKFALANQTASNITYICQDAVTYSAPNEYDAIVSFSALHWVSDYSRVLANIAESLKPGGKALLCHGIGIPAFPPIVHKLLATQKWNAYKQNAQLLKYPSLIEVASAIEKTRLSTEILELKKFNGWISGDVLIKNWLSLSLFDFIPANARDEFCKDVLQEYTKEYPLNEKNELFHSSPVIVMVLKK